MVHIIWKANIQNFILIGKYRRILKNSGRSTEKVELMRNVKQSYILTLSEEDGVTVSDPVV